MLTTLDQRKSLPRNRIIAFYTDQIFFTDPVKESGCRKIKTNGHKVQAKLPQDFTVSRLNFYDRGKRLK